MRDLLKLVTEGIYEETGYHYDSDTLMLFLIGCAAVDGSEVIDFGSYPVVEVVFKVLVGEGLLHYNALCRFQVYGKPTYTTTEAGLALVQQHTEGVT